MGHEHVFDDLNVMRHRDVDVYLRWPELWAFPRALAMDEEVVGTTNASLRLPDGQYFDAVFLNSDSELVRGLKGRNDIVFKDLSRVLPKEEMVIYKQVLDHQRVVDRIDIEFAESEAAHNFEEVFDPRAPWGHNYHDKVLAYLGSGEPLVLKDDGRKIFHQAKWVAGGISADDDLVVIVRHDHTVGSRFSIEVNGAENPEDLEFPCLAEQWGEIRLIIPRELLRDGENSFCITRDRTVEGEAEMYHMWFVQDQPGGHQGLTTGPS